MRREREIIRSAFLTLFFVTLSSAAEKPPLASWPFEQGKSPDRILGYHKSVPGVVGAGLRFDGQTTSVVRAAADAPRLGDAFTIEAWVAVQTYPWTWCALVNQERDRKAGYFFGLDPEGRFGLQIAVDGQWREVRSDAGVQSVQHTRHA